MIWAVLCATGALGQDLGPAAEVDQDRLLATIRGLPAPRAARGDEQSRANLLEAQQQLFDAFEQLGLSPRLEPIDLPGGSKDGPESERNCNVIVDLPGTDSASEVLVVSAHFDAVVGSPGADDDGTGVAAVLEIARILRERPMRRTVRLCLFNLEELGMVGSFYHVAQMVQARADEDDGGERVVGMICLDMLGYFTDEPGSQTSPIKPIPGVFEPPTVGDFIAVVGLLGHHGFNQSVVDAMVEASPGAKVWLADFSPIPLPDLMRSDHAAFLLAGMPAVMVTDTANFRNPHYHTESDAVGTLDAARFTAVVRGLVGAVYALAGPVEAEGDDGDPADPTTTAPTDVDAALQGEVGVGGLGEEVEVLGEAFEGLLEACGGVVAARGDLLPDAVDEFGADGGEVAQLGEIAGAGGQLDAVRSLAPGIGALGDGAALRIGVSLLDAAGG